MVRGMQRVILQHTFVELMIKRGDKELFSLEEEVSREENGGAVESDSNIKHFKHSFPTSAL